MSRGGLRGSHSIVSDPDAPFGELHEECGVFGIICAPEDNLNPAFETYHALFALQHRGQESCGIAVNHKGVISVHKDKGLVPDVFSESILNAMPGQMAIGHCRYSGADDGTTRESVQPLLSRHIKGNLAIAFNGALTNAAELQREIELSGGIFQTNTAAEIISHIVVRERLTAPSIEEAVKRATTRMTGAFSMIVMSARKMIAVRDPNGFRPLCLGKLGGSFIFASESCAVDALGGAFVRDIAPGEIVTFFEGTLTSDCCPRKGSSSLCVFEYIYFARPDSVIDGASVELARQEAGRYLALEHPVEADVVIGAPDSGIPAAIGYAKASGIPYGVGIIKNRYIGRTFIQPEQRDREQAVKIKLNALKPAVQGKRVVMVDDSIVRGTTTTHVVKILRDAGATEIHMRISSPPFRYPCFFGTDVPDRRPLIAVGRTVEEIGRIIGVDSLGYLSIEAAHKIAAGTTLGFCDGCFTGEYPVSVPGKTEKNIYETGLPE